MRGELCRQQTCCYTLLHGRLSTVDRALQQSSIDSQLFVQNRDLCVPTCIRRPVRGSPSEYCYDDWCGKTRMVWLPKVKKIEDIFIRFDRVHERDRQTGRRTERYLTTAFALQILSLLFNLPFALSYNCKTDYI